MSSLTRRLLGLKVAALRNQSLTNGVAPSSPRQAGLLILSVLLLSLAFAPVKQFYLAWVGLIPYLIAVRSSRSPWRAMFLGWAGGVLFFLANMWWLSYVTWGGMFALVAYLALFWGFAAVLVRGGGLLDRSRPLAGALILAAGWTAFEWVRGSYSMFGAHGLPWLYLGDTQTPFLAICQIADITGVYGVSFLIVLVNAVLARALIERRTTKKLAPSFVTVTVVLLATVGYGVFRLKQSTLFAGPTVLVVQPNYPQSNTGEKGAPQDVVVQFHVQKTREALQDCERRGIAVDLVVWSETMMPALNAEALSFNRGWGYGQMIETTLEQIGGIADQFRTNILVGATYAGSWAWENRPDGTYGVPADRRNSVYLFNQAGLVTPLRYDKIQLLPFGEFIPFRDSVPWLYRMLLSLGPPDMKSYELTAGEPDALTMFSIDSRDAAKPAAYRFVVPICFEDIVSPLVTDLMRSRFGEIGSESASGKRADFIVNVTNDGWFKAGERAQHLQAAVFRSIENRVPTARSVNTGISGFIDSTGHESDLLRENTEGWSVHPLMLDHRRAIHTVIGELFADCCAAVTAITIIVLCWNSRQRVKKPSNRQILV